jgi:hypothetical protein
MSANETPRNLIVVSPPRKPRYASRAARPATDKGAPNRESVSSNKVEKVASGG